MHTMTDRKVKSGTIDVKALLAGDEEFYPEYYDLALSYGLYPALKPTRMDIS
jgi:hypothetical protein